MKKIIIIQTYWHKKYNKTCLKVVFNKLFVIWQMIIDIWLYEFKLLFNLIIIPVQETGTHVLVWFLNPPKHKVLCDEERLNVSSIHTSIHLTCVTIQQMQRCTVSQSFGESMAPC